MVLEFFMSASVPLGQGYTETDSAYYLDQLRRIIVSNKGGRTASIAYTPQYGLTISDATTITDTITTSNPGAPTAFMVTGDKANQKLFLEFDQDLVDGSDNAHTATITGTETYTAGPLISTVKGQKAFSFNGSTDLTISTESDFDRERTDVFSISFWAKWTSASIMMLVTKMTAVSNTGYEIGVTAAGKIRIRLTNTVTTNEVDIISPLAYNTGAWNHFLFTKGSGSNAAACKLYVNGTAITMTVTTDNLSATILNAIPLVIGGYDGGTSRFTGSIFDFQFWNLELSSTDAGNLADGKQISKNGSVTTPAFSNFSVVAA
jgi:hypothetical protein